MMGRALTIGLTVAALFLTTFPASAEKVAVRQFEEKTWDEDPSKVTEVEEELGLVDLRSLDLSRTQLGNGYAGQGLRVRIPAGGYRGFGPFDRLDPAPQEAWFRYHIRLTNWNAASTGKLPGLAGIYSSSARGCIRPTEEKPGWSARGMFGAPGTNGAPEGRIPIGTYLYHATQAGDCGDGLWWGSIEQGRWYCVEGYIKMNTPGKNNGVLRMFLDGKAKLRQTNIQYRRAGETNIGVRHMWHNIYFGGTWPTPNPLSAQYDEVVVSTSRRVKCLPPFTDIGDTIHAKSIQELHALGYLYGCDYRKACPHGELTRAEAAAFLARTLNLPNTSKDYFRDDDGSIFEGVINRLAAAGITVGCDSGLYCPERTLTRAEFAAMLVRALHLRGPAPDAFTDDDGHWAEEAINVFAAAGLTHGCSSDGFCPGRPLPRNETASFFYRSLSLLKPLSQASAPPPADWPPEGDPPPIPPEEQD